MWGRDGQGAGSREGGRLDSWRAGRLRGCKASCRVDRAVGARSAAQPATASHHRAAAQALTEPAAAASCCCVRAILREARDCARSSVTAGESRPLLPAPAAGGPAVPGRGAAGQMGAANGCQKVIAKQLTAQGSWQADASTYQQPPTAHNQEPAGQVSCCPSLPPCVPLNPCLHSPSLPESLPWLEWADPEPTGAPRLGCEASTVW